MRRIGTFLVVITLLFTSLTQNVQGEEAESQHVPEVQAAQEYYDVVRQELEGLNLSGGAFLYGSREDEVTTTQAFQVDGVDKHKASAEIVSVENQPFKKAFRVTVAEASDANWKINLKGLTSDIIQKDDVILGIAYIRSVFSADETGKVMLGAAMKRFLNNQYYDWTKSDSLIQAGSDWRKYYFVFQADETAEAGEAWLEFFLGSLRQTVDIGGLALINFGVKDQTFIQSLPKTQFDFNYEGREPEAAWRIDAAQRIDQIRKENLQLRIVDENGQPIKDAEVKVRMKKHAFDLGAAVSSGHINGTNATYKQTLLKYFNKAVLDNDMKFSNWLFGGPAHHTNVKQALEWLRDNGLKTRGHTLVWPGFYWHDWLRPLKDQPQELKAAFETHIRDQMGQLQHLIDEWDVVNEFHGYKDITYAISGDGQVGSLADWFKIANEMDASGILYANDCVMFENPVSMQQHIDIVKSLIQEHNAPIEALGMEGHMDTINIMNPEALLVMLDKYQAEIGLPIQITEFDVNIQNPNDPQEVQAQVDYTRDFMTAVFSHPSIVGVTVWGFWQADMWRPNAAYFDREWNMKPNGRALFDLFYKEWWTNEDGFTDANGEYGARGFLGEYEIIVQKGDWIRKVPVTLEKGLAPLTVRLAEEDKDDTPPSKPSNLEASYVTETSIQLQWGASHDNNLRGYHLYSIDGNGNETKLNEGLISSTNYHFTSGSGGTEYRFIVKAVDWVGLTSEGSDQLMVKTVLKLDRAGWTAAASGKDANGLDAIAAIDGSNETRWSSGVYQSPNSSWFTVDMGVARRFNRLVLDTTSSSGDYPRGYAVYVSDNGTDWGQAVAINDNAPAGGMTDITFDAKEARYIRIVQTGSAGWAWWSIHELNVYDDGSEIVAPEIIALDRMNWTVEASGTNPGNPATAVIDGDATTRWSHGSAMAPGQTFTIDMGAMNHFNRIVLDATGSDNDYARGYKVYVSENGLLWSQPVASNDNAAGPVTEIVFPAKHARYIKLEQTGSVSWAWWGIHELTVTYDMSEVEPPVYGTNVALGKTAVASAVDEPDKAASMAVDGINWTRWAGPSSDPQWIYVDLGSEHTITGAVLKWESAYGRSYTIDVSQDGTTWEAVYTEAAGDGGTDNVAFAPVNARYVRMHGTGRGTGWGYSLYEFEVYGHEPVDSEAPSEVSHATVEAGDSQITIKWEDPGEADLHHIIVAEVNDATPEVIVGKGVQSASITGLTNGRPYSFLIQASDISGNTSAGIRVEASPAGPTSIHIVTPPAVLRDKTHWFVENDALIQHKNSIVTIEAESGVSQVILPVQASDLLLDNNLLVRIKGLDFVIAPEILKALADLVKSDSTASISLSVQSVPEPGRSNLPDELEVAGAVYSFELAAIDMEGKEHKLAVFPERIQVSMPYDQALNEALLGVYEWDEESSKWGYAGGEADRKTGRVIVDLEHFSTYAVMEYNKTFKDIPDLHWAAEAVKVLSARHIIDGKSNHLFDPTDEITRAEFVVMISRLLGLKAIGSAKFIDIGEDAWYATSVHAAWEAGIVRGRTEYEFAPNDAISRQEMAVMLVRAYISVTGHSAIDQIAASYDDEHLIAGWAEKDVAAALAFGLMRGSGEQFRPQSMTSRAETAQAIYNLLRLLVDLN